MLVDQNFQRTYKSLAERKVFSTILDSTISAQEIKFIEYICKLTIFQGIGAQALLRSNCAPEQPGALILAPCAPEHCSGAQIILSAPEQAAPEQRTIGTCSGACSWSTCLLHVLRLNAPILFTKIGYVVLN